MTKLRIFKVDSSDEEPLTELYYGEHVFGRGELLQCDDRRVSRAHGILKITTETATITSTHENPCFYKAAKSSTIMILPKDVPMNIHDGDRFALLADQYWFELKLEQNEINQATTILKAANSILKSIVYKEELPTSTCDSNQGVSFKRECENDESELLVKKAKTDYSEPVDSEIKTNENECATVLNDLKKDVLSESDEDDKQTKNKELLDNNQSEIIGSFSKLVKDGEEKNRKQATSKRDPRKVKQNNDESAYVAELKALLFSSDEDDNFELACTPVNSSSSDATKMPTPCTSTIKEDNENDKKKNKGLGKNNKNENVDKKVVTGNKKKQSDKDSAKDPENETDCDPNRASSSGTQNTKIQRDRCWYALDCYRKSATHLTDFSHPGDSDYASDPEDNRPICAYGAACYRRNPNHREQYKHPRDVTKNDAPGTRNPTQPKKRTTKKQYYDESSEDDYDLEDPFIADSGSEYEEDFISEDDSSDSDWNASDEEMKRLIKEAKKFTRSKK